MFNTIMRSEASHSLSHLMLKVESSCSQLSIENINIWISGTSKALQQQRVSYLSLLELLVGVEVEGALGQGYGVYH